MTPIGNPDTLRQISFIPEMPESECEASILEFEYLSVQYIDYNVPKSEFYTSYDAFILSTDSGAFKEISREQNEINIEYEYTFKSDPSIPPVSKSQSISIPAAPETAFILHKSLDDTSIDIKATFIAKLTNFYDTLTLYELEEPQFICDTIAPVH